MTDECLINESAMPLAPKRGTTLSSKDWRASMEALCAKSPEAWILRKDLDEIQKRLGGPAERPDDEKRAGVIAHKLNNMLCAVLLG